MPHPLPLNVAVRNGGVSIAAAVLLGGCVGESGPSPTPETIRRDSAGVVIVENGGVDRDLPWSYQVSFRLGGRPDGPEQFYEISAFQVATDVGGAIHVLDTRNYRVVKFDRDGNVEWQAGRAGGGPGEFIRPHRIHVDESGTTHIMDYGKDALVLFDSAGASTGQVAFDGLQEVAPTRYGTLGLRRDYTRKGGMVEELVSVHGSDTTVIFEAPTVPIAAYRLAGCGFSVGRTGPVIFGKATAWSVGGSVLAVSKEAAYTVDMWSMRSITLERSIRRSIPSEPATRALAVEWARLAKPGRVVRSDGGECVPPAEEVVDKQGFADSLPAIDDVRIDRHGRLWVQRYAIDSSQARIDVFDADGRYMGTLPRGYPWPVAFAVPDRILFVERDTLDIQRLVIAEIESDQPTIPAGGGFN